MSSTNNDVGVQEQTTLTGQQQVDNSNPAVIGNKDGRLAPFPTPYPPPPMGLSTKTASDTGCSSPKSTSIRQYISGRSPPDCANASNSTSSTAFALSSSSSGGKTMLSASNGSDGNQLGGSASLDMLTTKDLAPVFWNVTEQPSNHTSQPQETTSTEPSQQVPPATMQSAEASSITTAQSDDGGGVTTPRSDTEKRSTGGGHGNDASDRSSIDLTPAAILNNHGMPPSFNNVTSTIAALQHKTREELLEMCIAMARGVHGVASDGDPLNNSGSVHPGAQQQKQSRGGTSGSLQLSVRPNSFKLTGSGSEVTSPLTVITKRPSNASSNSNSNPGSNSSSQLSISGAKRRDRRRSTVRFCSLINASIDDIGNETLNQYVILAELGAGASGTVFMAVDDQDRTFAIKKLNATKARKLKPGAIGKSAYDRLQQEIAVMKKIRHPNCIRLHEVIDDPESEHAYLVMQYAECGPVVSLQGGTNRCKKLDMTRCQRIMRHLVRGLRHLHSNGIIHHDIKPDNILLGLDDRAYLADFGVSSVLEADAFAGSVRNSYTGTPAFMAPEMLDEDSEVVSGAAVDIWALGVTLHCMVHGCLPLRGRSMMELTNAITRGEIVIGDPDEPEGSSASHNSPTIDNQQTQRHNSMSSAAESSSIGPASSATPEELPQITTTAPNMDGLTTDDLIERRLKEAANDCLRGMLERSPIKRMTLQELALHPFVGLQLREIMTNNSAEKRGSLLRVESSLDPFETAHAIHRRSVCLRRPTMTVSRRASVAVKSYCDKVRRRRGLAGEEGLPRFREGTDGEGNSNDNIETNGVQQAVDLASRAPLVKFNV